MRKEPENEKKVAKEPLTEEQLCRRQNEIDFWWRRHLAERAELEEEASKTCHRGPGDSDYWRR